MFSSFKGNPTEIGTQYGRCYGSRIRNNLNTLVLATESERSLLNNDGFVKWRKRQEAILRKNWPWLLDEMAGVAKSTGIQFEKIFLLNLRIWQYELYFTTPTPLKTLKPKSEYKTARQLPKAQCSCLAITLSDGTVACAGTLDDPVEYYCGAIRIQPDQGYSFISFPLTGTSWANRGMNEKGLSVSVSSQVIQGLKPSSIQQDLAIRIILQTCASVNEVRQFCKEYPFNMNIVCSDIDNNIFSAHHTSLGLFEVPVEDGAAAMTNHIISDDLKEHLNKKGAANFPETPTTRPRLKNLIAFIRKRNKKCSLQEVHRFISFCDESDPGSINNHNSREETYVLTFSNPQNHPKTLWVMQPCESMKFELFNIRSTEI